MKNLRHPKLSPPNSAAVDATIPPGRFSSSEVARTRPEVGFHLAIGFALIAAIPGFSAITPTEWSHRQTLAVAAPGLTKIAVPASTFDASQPGLADLRVIDASGQEISYLLDSPPAATEESVRSRLIRPRSFDVASASNDTTQLILETGTTEDLDAIDLETSAPFFLKAAHLDVSPDGKDWQSLGPAVPVFRQFGAEHLRLTLNRKPAAFVRVTLDDFQTRPIDFVGAKLLRAPAHAAPRVLSPLDAAIARRDEFVGETVLTVALAGRHVPLAALEFQTKEPLFMRRITVAVREVSGAVSAEHTVASGTIYRVALDGAPTRMQLELPVEFTPLTRELLVHLYNGDSPPLAIDGVQAKQHVANLLFMAPTAGTYTLLSGNPQAAAPRYDLAVFAGEMRGANTSVSTPGALEPMPDYHPRESLSVAPLPDIPLTGAPLDPRDWAQRQPIQITRPGVQELELNLAALAQARADFADLRLLHAGNQIPYVLEQPALARSLTLTPTSVPDPKRPTTSVWRIVLPQSNLPVEKILLASATPLFSRQCRIFEKLTNQNGGSTELTLATGQWSRLPKPGVPESRAFEFSDHPRTNTLWIETDNGDNPAIALDAVQLVYPVVRMIFKVAETGDFALAYGNRKANAPRYDLSLVATTLLTASRNVAKLPADSLAVASVETGGLFAGIRNVYIFWGALGLVVVVLLGVVAKLLPKPPVG